MTRPNGVNTNYSYDSLSRLLSVLHQAGTSTIDGAVYTLDAAGNRTSKADQLAGVTSNYTYDALYELTQVTQASNTTESYTYDPVGNRLTSQTVASYTYNSSNELTAAGSVMYTYDSNGNATARTDTNGTTAYAWDFENRLTSLTLPSGGVVAFLYDAFGHRIYKQSPSATNIFVYDGDNLIETTNASAAETAGYTETPNLDEPLAVFGGKCLDKARVVADADAAVDSFSYGTKGGVWATVSGFFQFATFRGQGWAQPGPHFPNQAILDALHDNAFNTCSLTALGQDLHSRQDAYAHSGWPAFDHYLQWTRPDTDAKNDLGLADAAMSDTVSELRSFKAKCLSCCQ